MKKIQMLTQDNCPKCIILDQFLENGLNDEYKDQIEVIHRSNDEKLFMSLARKHGIMATPALICGDEVLVDTSEAKVKDFLLRCK